MTARLLTIDEVAARLRTSRRTAYRLARDIGIQPGGRWLFAEEDLERYIASCLRGRLQPRERHPLAQQIADHAAAFIAGLPGCCSDKVMTYFVAGGQLIKIGRSREERFSLRMAHLQCQSPTPLRILAVTRGDIEALLHEYFASHRAHGEWFSAEPILATLADVGGGCVRCFAERM